MVNKQILMGNVGKQPEVREVGSTNVANFSVATSERGYTNKAGKVIPPKTEWHNIVAWGALADLASNYVNKGDLIYIEGRKETRKWESADGETRSICETIATNITLMPNRTADTQPKPTQQAAPRDTSTDDDLPF